MLLALSDRLVVWTPMRAAPLCGNGILDPGERCDDGNLRHDDACPMDCRSVCGDGNRSEVEACDDGNQVDGDGCSAGCASE
jgi:cysteine-rich repeat protein